MPMRDELPPVRARAVAQPMVRRSVRAAIVSSEFQLIAAVCAIGYLTALNVMLRFPDISNMLAAYSIY